RCFHVIGVHTCALPILPPVMPPVTTGAPHVYRVPPGTIVVPLFTGVTVNVSPLQISVVRSGISGVGFTVTTSSNVSPTQFPDAPETGVTVQVADCRTFVRL